jgi:hypothetical protein
MHKVIAISSVVYFDFALALFDHPHHPLTHSLTHSPPTRPLTHPPYTNTHPHSATRHRYKHEVFEFAMNALLEPFGNAHVEANANSSRFGKLVELQFVRDGLEVAGSRIRHYLLEKVCVTE